MDKSLFDKLAAYRRIVRRARLSMTDYFIAWLLSRPAVASVVPSFSNSDQLRAAVAATAKTIPAEDRNKIDLIFEPPQRPGGEQVLCWKTGWVLEDRDLE